MADIIQVPNSDDRAKIKIISLAHNAQVIFFPYDFEFDDSYKPEWGTYDGFGRMDPIMTYKRTTRDVNLSFNVVAENENMAKTNFEQLQNLIHFMYPKYTDDAIGIEKSRLNALDKATQDAIMRARQAATFALSQGLSAEEGGAESPSTGVTTNVNGLRQEQQKIQQQITQLQSISGFGAQVMEKSPLFQVSFMNLLNKDDFVAAITNFKHKLKFDAADSSYSGGKAIPGEFSINLTFKVLHTYTPGSDKLKLNYGK